MAMDFQTVLDVGAYIGHHQRPRACEVECPYCRVLMVEAQPTEPPKRIVRVLRRLKSEPGWQRADVMAHVIPDSYRIVGCRECRSVFTVPKSFESALSVGAVARGSGDSTE